MIIRQRIRQNCKSLNEEYCFEKLQVVFFVTFKDLSSLREICVCKEVSVSPPPERLWNSDSSLRCPIWRKSRRFQNAVPWTRFSFAFCWYKRSSFLTSANRTGRPLSTAPLWCPTRGWRTPRLVAPNCEAHARSFECLENLCKRYRNSLSTILNCFLIRWKNTVYR